MMMGIDKLYTMMDRRWMIRTLFSTLLFSSLFTIAKGDPVDYDPEKIIETFNEAFMASNDDFITPHPHDKYFPFKKARKENAYIERDNYEEINSMEKAMNLTRELQEWRGFKTIETHNVSQLESFLKEFKSLGQSTQSNFLNSKLNKDQVEELSSGWLSLLASSKIMEETSVDNLVSIYNDAKLNTNLLYKFLILLRDPNNGGIRDGFLGLRIPEYLHNHVGYMFGYRWNLGKAVELEPKTLMVLPPDTIVLMKSDVLDNRRILITLQSPNAKEIFQEGDQQRKNAWFLRYLEEAGWDKAFDSSEKISVYGHLLAGATLEYLQRWELNQTFPDDPENLNVDQDIVFDAVRGNSFSRAREQVLWEALKINHRGEIFTDKANKLDISQLLAYEKALTSSGGPFSSGISISEFQQVQEKWLSKKTFFPEVNAEFFKTRIMKSLNETLEGWTTRNFQTFGEFTKMLSPLEIAKLVKEARLGQFTMTRLITPTMSMAQLNEIYKKFKAQIIGTERDQEVVDPSLFPALSSDDLLSPKPYFIWTEHKDKLLETSDMFTRGQMSALHELIKPGKWNSANISSILANHPKCLDDDPPRKVMANLDLILEGFETVPEKFYTIAEKLQTIPRHLKMAWLDKSLTDMEVLSSEILLDKPAKETELKEGISYPKPDHPLESTFKKFFSSNSESKLPSLVLAGMSCDHIERIEVQDTMEVLAIYRYQVELYGDLMPSSTRKCWAKQVRNYLMFKSSVLNITVTTETELLSMLNTAEIKTIGGEILLTWGGSVLSSIVNPEVNHEVLMEVALTKPVTFLTNGVKYSCVKEMARAMLGLMIEHEKGAMDLTVLTHTHNLLAFAGNSTIQAKAGDVKNYFRTVLRLEDKLMCLKKDDRMVLRNLIMKAFGSPENWNSLDLVELGDLLIVLEAEDWTKVDPTTLRMAAEELAVNTMYSDLITEPRHSTVPVPYHEACALWLGDDQGAESQESKDYMEQWRMYNRYIIVGNHLQFKVLDNGFDAETIQPRDNVKRRRRREADGSYDFKANYTYVMTKLNTMFREGVMTEEQKINATNIIIGTQELLADYSFAVLGLERNGMSQQEVLGVLQQYRDSGNMTNEQSARIAQLAIDTQARMVQGLAPLLGITAQELNITQETWDAIMKMETFVDPLNETTTTTASPISSAPARDLLDDGAEEPQETTLTPSSDEQVSSSTSSTTETTTVASTSPSTTLEVSSDESSSVSTSTTATTESTTVSTTESTTVSTASTESTTTLPENYREGRDEVSSESTSSTSTTVEAETTSSTSTTTSTSVDAESTSSSITASTTSDSTTSSTEGTSSSSTESSVSSEDSSEAAETSTKSSSTTPSSVDDNLSSVLKQNELLNLETFSSYEPDTAAFDTIPHLKNITLTCRVVKASKNAAAALSSNCINKMGDDLPNCWDILGHIPWPSSSLVPVWNVIKESIISVYPEKETPVNRDLMLQLETLMPAIVSESPELIDVAKENIDGISLIQRLLSWEDAKDVVQRYISVNSKSEDNPLTRVEAGALGPLLCGLLDDQWSTLITNQTYPSLFTRYLATLDCPVPAGAAGHLSERLVSAYGSPHTWSTADVLSMGWMVSTLSPEQLASVPNHAMEGLTGHAVKHFTALQWTSLTAGQLQYMSPHTASFISVKKLASMGNMGSKMREIRAAVGEDPMAVGEMEKMFDSGSPTFHCSILIMVFAVMAIYL